MKNLFNRWFQNLTFEFNAVKKEINYCCFICKKLHSHKTFITDYYNKITSMRNRLHVSCILDIDVS